ncbi:MAG: hypothetical protein EGQ85_04510 [Faecalibacterium prausnitzii]|nr:hypothetical protein [Faecalibacterium prausnitzii]
MRSAFALRIFSGKIIYKFGIPERLRTLRYSIFTGGFSRPLGEGGCDQREQTEGVSFRKRKFLQFMELAQAFSFWRLTASPGIRIL